MAQQLIGQSVKRVEDQPLVSGAGRYVDDIHLPGMLHMAVARCPYPKARIVGIDAEAARGTPGVRAVLTGEDIAGLNDIPSARLPGVTIPPHPPLARGYVAAAGTPVAAVVAASAAQAVDAAALIEIEYEPLDSVADPDAALAEGAVKAREEMDSNISYTLKRESGDVEVAFAAADKVVKLRISSPRLASIAMEPRGVVVSPEPFGRGLTVWLSTQTPHRARADLAQCLGFPENDIRVIAPDVGGGFGSKGCLYREDVLAAHLALRLGCPIKWVATRRDDIMTTIQGRDMTVEAELAAKSDGTLTGLKVHNVANLGAYLHSSSALPPMFMLNMAPGCYKIPNVRTEVVGVLTNTTPTGPYRGAGRPEAVLAIERMIDQAARELGIDQVEIRKKNFIPPQEFPFTTATGAIYDSGDYGKALDKALDLAGYGDVLRRRDEARARGELMGVGISSFVEPSGGAGFESGTVRVERGGSVTVVTGSSSHGQAHETVWAQVVADQLQVPMDRIKVLHGDTRATAQSVGTFGSRSAILGGGALVRASAQLVDKAKRIAATLLEASADDMELREDGFAVVGAPEKKINWQGIALAAYQTMRLPAGEEPGLEATSYFDPKKEMWGFGAHVATVRIDPETGEVHIERLAAVDDCGNVLNPMVVEGQVQGGIAQALGQALLEQVVFDSSGQTLTGSLMDYAVPRAEHMPPLVLGHTHTPSPYNPLGVKGVGEAGTNGAPPAIANAVMDALSPLGVRHLDMPYTAPKIWQAIQDATS